MNFTSTNTLQLYTTDGTRNAETPGMFRDPAAWYHVAVVVDTTQSANADCIKIFVNGVQQTLTFSGSTWVTYDFTSLNAACAHYVGYYTGSSHHHSGYLADFYFIDGAAVVPTIGTNFIQEDPATGQLKPKTYGMAAHTGNSFHMPFDDNAGNGVFPDSSDATATNLTWAFEDSSGTAVDNTTFVDSSDSGHTISTGGNTYHDSKTKVADKSSINFDGSVDYLSVPSSSDFGMGTGDFTAEFWVRFDSVASTQWMTGAGDTAAANEFDIAWYSSNLLYVYLNQAPHTFSWTPVVDTWYHVAVARSGTALEAFIDGTQIGTTASSSDNIPTIDLLAGRQTSAGAAYYLNGNLDEIRIVKGHAVYTGNFAAPTALTTTGGTYSSSTNVTNPTAAQTKLLIHSDGIKHVPSGVAGYNSRVSLETPGHTRQEKRVGSSSIRLGGRASTNISPIIRVPPSPDFAWGASDEWTIELWARFDYAGQNYIWSQYSNNSGNGDEFRLSTKSGFDGFDLQLGSSTLSPFYNLKTDTWYHIAVRSQSSPYSQVNIYVNGNLLDNISFTAIAAGYAGGNLQIGAYDNGNTAALYGMEGHIDEFRISSKDRPTDDALTWQGADVAIVDSGNTGHTIYGAGAAHSTAEKKFDGSSIKFDPPLPYPNNHLDGDYLSIDDHSDFNFSTTGIFTVEGWFRFDDVDGDYGLVSKVTSGNNYDWSLQHYGSISGGNIFFYDGATSNATWDVSSVIDTDDTWYHIAVVGSANYGTSDNVTLYIDGSLQGTRTTGAAYGAGTGPLLIGRADNTGNTYDFDGYIDEVRISNIDRSGDTYFGVETVPFVSDSNTKLLIHSDNTSTSSTAYADDDNTLLLIHSDGYLHPTQQGGDAQHNRAQQKFDRSGILFDGTTDYIRVSDQALHQAAAGDFNFGTREERSFTIEFWMKADAHSNIYSYPFSTMTYGSAGWNYHLFYLYGSGASQPGFVSWYAGTDSSNNINRFSTARFDDNAWHHVACVCDSSAASTTLAYNLYVDGVLQVNLNDNSTGTPDLDSLHSFYIGDWSYYHEGYGSSPDGYAGYLDEFRISNSARYQADFSSSLPTTAFATDANTLFLLHSDWSGGIGADSSGNNNDFLPNSIGDHDKVLDRPTVGGNYATLNPLAGLTTSTFTEGNLVGTCPPINGAVMSTIALPSTGKWYCEFEFDSVTTYATVGVGRMGMKGWNTSQEAAAECAILYGQASDPPEYGVVGSDFTEGTTTGTPTAIAADTVYGLMWDADASDKTLKVTDGTTTTSCTYTTTPSYDIGFLFGTSSTSSTGTVRVNFGQDPTLSGSVSGVAGSEFYLTKPEGYLALNTGNLPDPDITDGTEHFDTLLYTGSGAHSGLSFQPDLVWVKARGDIQDHKLTDSVRGEQINLIPNETTAEGTESLNVGVMSFDAGGFTIGSSSSASGPYANTAGAGMAAWNWKADQDGVGGSGVNWAEKYNSAAGLSIVKWSGNADTNFYGSEQTISHYNHGPTGMIIAKARTGHGVNDGMDTGHWIVWHKELASDYFLTLDTDNGQDSWNHNWNANMKVISDVTDTSIKVGNGNSTNGPAYALNYDGTSMLSGVEDYIGYFFSEKAGYSKFGAYTGNGAYDGPFVWCDQRPAWLLIKRSDSAEDWWVLDVKRDTYNAVNQLIYANDSSAEITGAGNNIPCDILSNGFKLRTDNMNWNDSGGTYVFAAFSENPFKTSVAR